MERECGVGIGVGRVVLGWWAGGRGVPGRRVGERFYYIITFFYKLGYATHTL